MVRTEINVIAPGWEHAARMATSASGTANNRPIVRCSPLPLSSKRYYLSRVILAVEPKAK
jgi:hypothetical protein